MILELIHIAEYALYIYLSISVGYIVLFSIASLFFKQKKYPETPLRQRFVIFIPAYKEDTVIHACVASVLQQTYEPHLYDVVVISDHMRPETNAALRQEHITLIELHEEESSKAKALRIATEQMKHKAYHYAIILDADNLIPPYYLHELNKATSQGIKAIQTHRKAKNTNTDTAILDAVIEEMNNSIFRKGHVRLGFSSALIGSGMAFDFQWFAQNIIHTHSAGEDKELEELLLRQGIHIEYIDTVETWDEKVQLPEAMHIQRRRWIATQLFLAVKMGQHLPSALLTANGDYLLKALQSFLPPRSILIGLIGVISLIACIFSPLSSIKWWILLILLIISLYIAIPSCMRHRYTVKIIKRAPCFILGMAGNLFHLKGMAKKFIHTQHG